MAYEKECANLVQYRVEGSASLHEIVFFLTNRCNQRCLTCWQWEDDFKSIRKELSDEMWIRLLTDAISLGAKHFYIVGGGEPMVRGDLVIELAEIAKQNDLFCVLHTNGTLLKKEQMDKLISLRWNQIIFSIDGPNPEINDFIRGKGTFEKAIFNLMYLSGNRKKDGNISIPDLGINFTITNRNYLYIEEMVELAKRTGCGGIHATLVQPFNKQAEEFVLRDEEIEKCKETLLKAQTKAESLGLYHTFNAVMEGLERKSTIKNSNSKNREHYNSFINTYCFEPFLSLTISAEGKVSPCCMFWKDENPSVLEHTLNEIWNGSFFRDIRNRLITGDIPDICMNCPSQLRQRSENIRIELQKMGEKTANTPLALLVRFINRLRKEGLYSALRRVKEWLYIKTGKL